MADDVGPNETIGVSGYRVEVAVQVSPYVLSVPTLPSRREFSASTQTHTAPAQKETPQNKKNGDPSLLMCEEVDRFLGSWSVICCFFFVFPKRNKNGGTVKDCCIHTPPSLSLASLAVFSRRSTNHAAARQPHRPIRVHMYVPILK